MFKSTVLFDPTEPRPYMAALRRYAENAVKVGDFKFEFKTDGTGVILTLNCWNGAYSRRLDPSYPLQRTLLSGVGIKKGYPVVTVTFYNPDGKTKKKQKPHYHVPIHMLINLVSPRHRELNDIARGYGAAKYGKRIEDVLVVANHIDANIENHYAVNIEGVLNGENTADGAARKKQGDAWTPSGLAYNRRAFGSEVAYFGDFFECGVVINSIADIVKGVPNSEPAYITYSKMLAEADLPKDCTSILVKKHGGRKKNLDIFSSTPWQIIAALYNERVIAILGEAEGMNAYKCFIGDDD
jgi:hypothetical protein